MNENKQKCEVKKAALTIEAIQQHLALTAQSRQYLLAKRLQSWPKSGLRIKKH